MHHGVKFSYDHSLYKRGGKIFIPHVLWDVIFYDFSYIIQVEETLWDKQIIVSIQHEVKIKCDMWVFNIVRVKFY